MARWKRIKNNGQKKKEEVYKACLLQEEEIQDLFKRRLTQYLAQSEVKQDINQERTTLIKCN
jgi:hypothetical protein